MSLESILNHILGQANAEREKIIQQARQQAEKIIRQAGQEAENLSRQIIAEERNLSGRTRQRLIVNARLAGRKDLLKAKQELIDTVFEKLKLSLGKAKLKKQQVTKEGIEEVSEDIGFYLNKIRSDFENEIAKALFG